MADVKAWAKRGAEKLDDSISVNPFKGGATKTAMEPLIESDNFKDNVKDVSKKLKNLAKFDGPIGKDGDNGRSSLSAAQNYPKSQIALVFRRSHMITSGESAFPKATTCKVLLIRKTNSTVRWRRPIQSSSHHNESKPKSTRRGPRRNTRVYNVPPYLAQVPERKRLGRLDSRTISEVTARDALQKFKARDTEELHIRPVHVLLESSFTRNVFHEMFHLSAFGGMIDDFKDLYLWVNNVNNKNREDPDLLAIIAVVIELLNRDSRQYKVSEEGVVSLGKH